MLAQLARGNFKIALLLGLLPFALNAQNVDIQMLKMGKFEENVMASYFLDGELFFCWDREVSNFKKVENENGSNFLQLYSVPVEKNKVKEEPVMLPEIINATYNQGPISFCSSTNQAFFSANKKVSEGEYKLCLCSSDYQNGNYSNVSFLDILDSNFNLAHPALFNEGESMVFASDLNGKYSKSDLFISHLKNGVWTDPKVIKGINSSKSETFPTIYGDNLYFSSDRNDGYGGLDIYQSEINDDGTFGKPVLMKEPFNSNEDDFLFLPISGKAGYLSSNRKNSLDRVYYYEMDIPVPGAYTTQTNGLCFKFEDTEATGEDYLKYTWSFGDGTSEEGVAVKHCFSDTGLFNVSCNILDGRTGELYKDVATYEVQVDFDYPFIDYRKSEDGKRITVFANNKFADDYDRHYWVLNGAMVFDEELNISLDSYSKIEINLISYQTRGDKVIGVKRKLR